jgi:hypothetical protein
MSFVPLLGQLPHVLPSIISTIVPGVMVLVVVFLFSRAVPFWVIVGIFLLLLMLMLMVISSVLILINLSIVDIIYLPTARFTVLYRGLECN